MAVNPNPPFETLQKFGMKTYRRLSEAVVEGKGSILKTEKGRYIIDLVAGVATNQLGHCHPELLSTINHQASRLMHVPGSIVTQPQADLAKSLCEVSGFDRVFFTPCGTTAIETALKIAKKRKEGKIIALKNSFHGRTLGSLSATMQAKFQNPFEPLVPGFIEIELNNIPQLEHECDDATAAIILEPIQGESGVNAATTEFLQAVERRARESGALFICDEIQTGMGRTGSLFNFQQHSIQPDILVLAKGLGSGIPIGACLARGEAADVLEPGDHGSTSGGNPLACAVANKVLEIMLRDDLPAAAKETGDRWRDELAKLPAVDHVRGAGLMLGVGLKRDLGAKIVEFAWERGVFVNSPNARTLRLVPALNIEWESVERATEILAGILDEVSQEP